MGWKRTLIAAINYLYRTRKKGTRETVLDAGCSTAGTEEMSLGRKSR